MFYYDITQTNTDDIELNTDTIYLGLKGESPITIKNDGTTLTLLGNNTDYTGNITVSDNIETIQFGENSFVNVLNNNKKLNYVFIGSNDVKVNSKIYLNSLILRTDNVTEENVSDEDKIKVRLQSTGNKTSSVIFVSKIEESKGCILYIQTNVIVTSNK